jgi:predicted nucleic acid-binding protein
MKQKLFLDTNIIIDLLGEREPFYNLAAKIASLADAGRIKIVISTLSFANVFYILSKFENQEIVKEKIRKFKVITESSDLTEKIISKALNSKFADFEDALQYYCAIQSNCNILITRNAKDFKESNISVLSPKEFLASWKLH